MTVSGKTIGENCKGKETWDRRVIYAFDKPILPSAGFLNLKGSLFDSASEPVPPSLIQKEVC